MDSVSWLITEVKHISVVTYDSIVTFYNFNFKPTRVKCHAD